MSYQMNVSNYYGQSKQTHPHGGTPDHIIQKLKSSHDISDFDPCPNNPTFDGLSIEWPSQDAIYVNPPYTRGQIKKWVEKCHKEWKKGKTVIMLIPSYTDTAYFHDFIYGQARLEFLRGRLKFKGYDSQASFPSMLVYFEKEEDQ